MDDDSSKNTNKPIFSQNDKIKTEPGETNINPDEEKQVENDSEKAHAQEISQETESQQVLLEVDPQQTTLENNTQPTTIETKQTSREVFQEQITVKVDHQVQPDKLPHQISEIKPFIERVNDEDVSYKSVEDSTEKHDEYFTPLDFFTKVEIPLVVKEGCMDDGRLSSATLLEQHEESEATESYVEEMSNQEDLYSAVRDAAVTDKKSIISRITITQLMPRKKTAGPSIEGDFRTASKGDEMWLLFGTTMPITTTMEEVESEEEEKAEEKISDVISIRTVGIVVNRDEYYDKIRTLTEQQQVLKITNNILERRLCMYYRRKNMPYALSEKSDAVSSNQINEYTKKLDLYDVIIKSSQNEKLTLKKQLKNLEKLKEVKEKQLTKIFQYAWHREIEVGKGLIYRKTGKEISDGLINHYVNRQKVFMDELAEMRLKYIKLKTLVTEKLEAIAKMDKIDEGYYLQRYIKLKSENRHYEDKVEEKEEELAKLRNMSMKTVQYLAHIREKSAAADNDIMDLQLDSLDLEETITDLRQKVNKFKQEKDRYRFLTTKMKEESGLLTEPALLLDMEHNQHVREDLKKEIVDIKTEFKTKTKQIKNIRRCVDSIDVQKRNLVKMPVVPSQTPKQHVLYRLQFGAKPCVFRPILSKSVFNDEFKPTVKKILIQSP